MLIKLLREWSNEAFVKKINERAGLRLQTWKLIFHSKNCHIYERQYKLVEELLAGQKPSRLTEGIALRKEGE